MSYVETKEQRKVYNATNYKKNKEKIKTYIKAKYIERTPTGRGDRRGERFKSLYGITIEDYNTMFDNQNGCCAICNTHYLETYKGLSVDHCHVTGKVRGLLCNNCNRSLGLLKDNIEVLEKAINYLRRIL